METLYHDLRYALRALLKAPGFAAVVILTLALGIGANSAIFTLVNAVLLKPLPVQDPQRLAIIGDPSRAHGTSIGSPRTDLFSFPLYQELLRRDIGLESMTAASFIGRMTVQEAGQPPDTEGQFAVVASGNYFSVLGVRAYLGRLFTPDDDKQAWHPRRPGRTFP